MDESNKSQTLFLDSRKRDSGTPQSWTVNVAPGLVVCKQGEEHLRIQLQTLEFLNDFPAINESNDRFTFESGTLGSVTIQLEHGCPRLVQVAKQIENLYPAASVTFDETSNTFVFQFIERTSLSFTGTSYDILGFTPFDAPSGTYFESTTAIKIIPVDNVFMKLSGVNPIHSANLDNVTGALRTSHILMHAYLGNSEPFSYFNYFAIENHFILDIVDNELVELTFSAFDLDGNPLLSMPEQKLTLKVDTVAISNPFETQLTAISGQLERLIDLTNLALVVKYFK
jgi:hypothetical protein